jgi:hypothetical protein
LEKFLLPKTDPSGGWRPSELPNAPRLPSKVLEASVFDGERATFANAVFRAIHKGARDMLEWCPGDGKGLCIPGQFDYKDVFFNPPMPKSLLEQNEKLAQSGKSDKKQSWFHRVLRLDFAKAAELRRSGRFDVSFHTLFGPPEEAGGAVRDIRKEVREEIALRRRIRGLEEKTGEALDDSVSTHEMLDITVGISERVARQFE